MKRNLFLTAVFIVVSLRGIYAESVWEGNAAVSRYGELPATGFFASSNTFPLNSLISVTSASNGKSVTLYIISPLADPGIFLLLSPQAAQELGIEKGTVAPVRARKADSGERTGVTVTEEKPKPSLPDAGNPTPSGSRISSPSADASAASASSLNPGGKNLLESIREEMEARKAASGEASSGKSGTKSVGNVPAEEQASPSIPPIVLSSPSGADESPEASIQPAEKLAEKTASIPPAAAVVPIPGGGTEQSGKSSSSEPGADAKSFESNPAETIGVPPLSEKPLVAGTESSHTETPSESVSAVPPEDGISDDSLPAPSAVPSGSGEPRVPDVTFQSSSAEMTLAPFSPKSEGSSIPPATPRFTPSAADAGKAGLPKPSMSPDSRITLEPAEPRPPVSSGPGNGKSETPAVLPDKNAGTSAVAASESASASGSAPERTPVSVSVSTVESVKLRKGEHYLQLGTYSSSDMVQKMAKNVSSSFPTVIIPSGTEGKQVFKLYVGPIREDESGLLLRTFRNGGFRDAYLKKGE